MKAFVNSAKIRFLLALCLCVAVVFLRFVGLNWDEGTWLHPDERFLISLVPRLQFPGSLAGWFDSSISPFAPQNLPATHYVYGQLPLVFAKMVSRILGRDDIAQLVVPLRFLSACFDVGTVLFTYFLARQIWGKWAALGAAILVAGAALHLQQAHFFVVDTFAAFFLTAAFWAGARWLATGKTRWAFAIGALWGAALSCKISAFLFVAPVLFFPIFGVAKHGSKRGWLFCLVAMSAAFLGFRLGNPMAFAGQFGALWGFFDWRINPAWQGDLAHQARISRGEVDVPFNVQWIGRTPFFPLWNLAGWGYGAPFALSALAGWGLLGLQIAKKRAVEPVLGVAAIWAMTLLVVQGAAFSLFTRYYLPLTPVAALFAVFFWRELAKFQPRFRIGAPVVVGLTVLWALAVTSIYRRPNTRVAASRWMHENIPHGAVVAHETEWDDILPLTWMRNSEGQFLPDPFRAVDLRVFEVETFSKREHLLAALESADWIVLSSPRAWKTVPRWSRKWPVATEFYRALFDGSLGFRLEREFVSYPQIGPLPLPDDNFEEALLVYDHPRVLIFRKTARWSSQNARRILEKPALPAPQQWQPRHANQN